MNPTLTITTLNVPGNFQTGGGVGAPAFGGFDLASQRLGGASTSFPGFGFPQNSLDPHMQALFQLNQAEQLLGLFSAVMTLGQMMGLNGNPQAAGGGTPAIGGSSPSGGAASSGGASSTGATNSTTASTGPVTEDVEKVVKTLDPAYQENARKHFPGIMAECKKQNVTDKAQVAYILATTVHESGAGKWMEEIASGSAYEGRRDLGNTQSGDGVRYKGRGYVQITGRNNYSDWSKRLGVDLVGNPELAEKPEYASRILVEGMAKGTFTGKKLSDYLGNGKTDFEGARRIVNGTDKASKFADTARKIMAAL